MEFCVGPAQKLSLTVFLYPYFPLYTTPTILVANSIFAIYFLAETVPNCPQTKITMKGVPPNGENLFYQLNFT